MRAALALLLLPAFAAATPPEYSTTITIAGVDEATETGALDTAVRTARGKLDQCWRKAGKVKLTVTVTGGAVKQIELVEVDPKAPLRCLTKVLRKIKNVPDGVFTVALDGTHLLDTLVMLNTTRLGALHGNGTATGVGSGLGTGTAPAAGNRAPSARVSIGVDDAKRLDIDRVIRARAGNIRACYERELHRAPKLAGKVVVKFQIAADGSVRKGTVHSTTLASVAVERCILAAILRARFPARDVPSDVTYPFTFAPGG